MTIISSTARGRRGRRPLAEGPALDRSRLVQVLLEMAREGGVEALNIRARGKRTAARALKARAEAGKAP